MIVEIEAELAERLATRPVERLRALGPIGDSVAAACHRAGVVVDPSSVTGNGRVELPHWLREQAISRTMHRHGRVVDA